MSEVGLLFQTRYACAGFAAAGIPIPCKKSFPVSQTGGFGMTLLSEERRLCSNRRGFQRIETRTAVFMIRWA